MYLKNLFQVIKILVSRGGFGKINSISNQSTMWRNKVRSVLWKKTMHICAIFDYSHRIIILSNIRWSSNMFKNLIWPRTYRSKNENFKFEYSFLGIYSKQISNSINKLISQSFFRQDFQICTFWRDSLDSAKHDDLRVWSIY